MSRSEWLIVRREKGFAEEALEPFKEKLEALTQENEEKIWELERAPRTQIIEIREKESSHVRTKQLEETNKALEHRAINDMGEIGT